MGYGDRDRGRGRQDDGKYVRLTGLWENRNKRGMFTGKIRNQDIGKILRKLEDCDGNRSDVVVFLWENNNKRGQKDPDFTVQIAEAEDRGGGRGGYSNRDRGRDGRDRDRDERDDRDGRSDRGGHAREDERDGRDEDDRDSGSDDDGGEEDSERRSRPASKGESKSSKGGSKSSSSGGVKDKAPAKGKGKKEDDW